MKSGAQLHRAGEVNGRRGNHSCDRPVAQAAGLKAAATPLQRLAIWNKAEELQYICTRHCTWYRAGELPLVQLLRFCRVTLGCQQLLSLDLEGRCFGLPFFLIDLFLSKETHTGTCQPYVAARYRIQDLPRPRCGVFSCPVSLPSAISGCLSARQQAGAISISLSKFHFLSSNLFGTFARSRKHPFQPPTIWVRGFVAGSVP